MESDAKAARSGKQPFLLARKPQSDSGSRWAVTEVSRTRLVT